MDDADSGVRNADALVERLDRRIVPVLDLAEIDLREDGPGQPEVGADAVEAIVDRGAGEGPRDLEAAAAGGELASTAARRSAPKSTVRFVIAAIPPPEPIGL